MNMLAALGAEPPVYAHLPMILGPDGAKLSKRHGAVDIREYREMGYLREAMLNYLVRLGWSYGNQEIFSIDEMVSFFDLADVNQSASAFNPEKLLWINQQHMIAMPADELGQRLQPFLVNAGLDVDQGPDSADVADGYHERAETLADMADRASYCYRDFDEIDPKAAKKHLRPVVLEPLQAFRDRLADLANWERDDIAAVIETVAAQHELSLGKLGQPVRVAVSGVPVSPPIDVTIWLVGRERAIRRLDHAIDLIEARKAASGG
jgi:glutamyl-tRNA synthetase